MEYTDLAPIDHIENGAEYLNALDLAIRKKKLRNIALAGPYGSGKSSIIESYLRHHPIIRKRALKISMATFVENVVDVEGNAKKADIDQREVERGILKQLFYKVDYKKTPQSRYRKLHKINWLSIWVKLLLACAIAFVLVYIFFPDFFSFARDRIVTAGSSVGVSDKKSLLLFGVFALGILVIIALSYRSFLARFKVKEIKLPIDATVKNGEDINETVFDKHLDEIVYFFEETKFELIFFEDLDRFDDTSVFVHLRELNTLLNNYSAIKRRIVFVYAVKDDIFSDADRRKFFEFIIPVIPIINTTNSGEILLEKLQNSLKVGIEHEISQNFVLDISPYIFDMRILHNIYNEFLIYKRTLRESQELKLLDEPMMALIIFKNLYPCDFADIQMEKGVIKKAFEDKQRYAKYKRDFIQNDIDAIEQILIGIRSEALASVRELRVSFLCAITDWQGMATSINATNHRSINADAVIEDSFDLSQWCNSSRCSGDYTLWNERRGSFTCNRFSEICAAYIEREKTIKEIKENRIIQEKQKIEKLKEQQHEIVRWTLGYVDNSYARTLAQIAIQRIWTAATNEAVLLA